MPSPVTSATTMKAASTVESTPSMSTAESTAPEAVSGEMMPSVVPMVIVPAHDESATIISTVVAIVGTVVSIVRPGVAAVNAVTDPRIQGAAI
jgi:hypothetical protein